MNRPSSLRAWPGRRGTAACCIDSLTCWVRLFRKRGWDDLDRITEIIAGLREDQKRFEKGRLQNGSLAEDRAIDPEARGSLSLGKGYGDLGPLHAAWAASQPVWVARQAL